MKDGVSSVLVHPGFSRKLVGWSNGKLLLSRKLQDQLTDGQTPYESWFHSPSAWPTVAFGAEVNFFPQYKRPGSGASVRRKSRSWNMHGLCLERAENWTGDLLIVDTDDLKTFPLSEIHEKEIQIKTCKKDSRDPPAVYKAESDFRRESRKTSSEEKEEGRDLYPDPNVEV